MQKKSFYPPTQTKEKWDRVTQIPLTDLEAVQRCPGHTVVLGEAHHHDLSAVPDQTPQPRVPRALDVSVVKEGGVGVYQGVGALLNHLGLFGSGQTRMEIGA